MLACVSVYHGQCVSIFGSGCPSGTFQTLSYCGFLEACCYGGSFGSGSTGSGSTGSGGSTGTSSSSEQERRTQEAIKLRQERILEQEL
ncbi:hypothetical protein CHS0354_042266 [Potamilus streckersoni]|uniref:Uncharacterized protein n=1 Tax=Potamilus streckersoni TaxID=2493646 RepID=A0AAE0STR3_9BIVA|nr:hypothetical protein CHS0354_042266 [Potamilus streckersoni]